MLAARPPEYWPGPLFMALVDAAELVVLGDTLQYSRQSFQNRTLVRTPQGSQWLSIPLAGGQHGRPIDAVVIRGKHRWIRKHRRALHFNYRTSPFFDFYEPELEPLFEADWDRLGALTCRSVQILARLLGIETPIIRASELEGRPATTADIVDAAGGHAGIVGAGSAGTAGYMSASDTLDVDMELTRVRAAVYLEPLEYRQNFEGFEEGMSALDLLFNYGPDSLSMIRRSRRVDDRSIHPKEQA